MTLSEKLSQMTLKQLRRAADKRGVAYTDTTSEAKLIKRLQKAIKAGKPKSDAVEAPAVETWPEAWPQEMRAAYYQQIVEAPMPDDEAEAYASLREAIQVKAPDVEPVRMKLGYSCFGLWYSPELKQCSMACQVMPLCKHVCETRPDLKERVAQLEKAAQDIASQAKQEDVVPDPIKPKVTKRPIKPKPAKIQPAAVPIYQWVGDITAYQADGDDDEAKTNLQIYQWMASKKRHGPNFFTSADLTRKLAPHYEDGADVARQMLEYLLEEKDVQVVNAEAKVSA